MHSVVRKSRASLASAVASALVVLFAASIIIAATLLTFELIIVEAGLEGAITL